MATDEELKTWMGKPHYKRRITYAYSPQMNAFTFFAPDRGRHMNPIGVFTPIDKSGITYDVEHLVEEIAETMSMFDSDEYFDIESEN